MKTTILCLIALAACAPHVETPPTLAEGTKAPAFAEKDLDGKPIKFPTDYKGKVVLLNFWATWCHPCVAEQPLLAGLYQKYHGPKFDIVAVTLDDTKQEERIRAVMDQKDMAWRQVYQGSFIEGSICKAYFGTQGLSIPKNYLVDGDTGEILASNPSPKDLEQALNRAMTKKFGSAAQ